MEAKGRQTEIVDFSDSLAQLGTQGGRKQKGKARPTGQKNTGKAPTGDIKKKTGTVRAQNGGAGKKKGPIPAAITTDASRFYETAELKIPLYDGGTNRKRTARKAQTLEKKYDRKGLLECVKDYDKTGNVYAQLENVANKGVIIAWITEVETEAMAPPTGSANTSTFPSPFLPTKESGNRNTGAGVGTQQAGATKQRGTATTGTKPAVSKSQPKGQTTNKQQTNTKLKKFLKPTAGKPAVLKWNQDEDDVGEEAQRTKMTKGQDHSNSQAQNKSEFEDDDVLAAALTAGLQEEEEGSVEPAPHPTKPTHTEKVVHAPPSIPHSLNASHEPKHILAHQTSKHTLTQGPPKRKLDHEEDPSDEDKHMAKKNKLESTRAPISRTMPPPQARPSAMPGTFTSGDRSKHAQTIQHQDERKRKLMKKKPNPPRPREPNSNTQSALMRAQKPFQRTHPLIKTLGLAPAVQEAKEHGTSVLGSLDNPEGQEVLTCRIQPRSFWTQWPEKNHWVHIPNSTAVQVESIPYANLPSKRHLCSAEELARYDTKTGALKWWLREGVHGVNGNGVCYFKDDPGLVTGEGHRVAQEDKERDDEERRWEEWYARWYKDKEQKDIPEQVKREREVNGRWRAWFEQTYPKHGWVHENQYWPCGCPKVWDEEADEEAEEWDTTPFKEWFMGSSGNWWGSHA